MGDGLGLQGPWGLASLQASIRQRQLDRMAQQQQEFQNMIALRGANRADTQQQLLAQQHADTVAEATRMHTATEADRTFRENQTLNESIPGGTQYPESSPIVGRLMTVGGVRPTGIMTDVPAGIAADPTQTTSEVPGTVANAPSLTGHMYTKIPSQKESTAATDFARKQDEFAQKQADAQWRIGIQQQLADIKGSAAPASSYQLQPEIDPKTGQQTGRFLGYNTKLNRWEPVQGQGPEATKAPPSATKALPYQAAENVAGLNTAEVEGVKVLKALHSTGLDTSNNPADPRWQKFVVTTLKMAPGDFNNADIQQRTAFVNAALTRQLMGGRPSQYVAQLIQDHMPKGEMTGMQLAHVLSNVLEQSGERRKELGSMLPGVKGPSSGQGYADYLQELSGSPSGVKVLSIQQVK